MKFCRFCSSQSGDSKQWEPLSLFREENGGFLQAVESKRGLRAGLLEGKGGR